MKRSNTVGLFLLTWVIPGCVEPELSREGSLSAASIVYAGSAGAGDAADAGPEHDAPSYEEVFAQGLTRYVDTSSTRPTRVTTSGWGPGAITTHHFSSAERGPVCMYGSEFFVETREGRSDDLLIFLEGGGVCLDTICAATPEPILTLDLFNVASLVGIGGLLHPTNPDNPLRDYDVVNVPYCDGSLFMGDVDRILSDGNDANGAMDQAYQHGLQNLTAAIATAHRTFPNPRRIVLVGSSGGAYGVLAGTAMVRRFYPDLPLLVISDSGAPIVNGEDPEFIHHAVEQLGASHLIPQSCPDCIANGHTTGFFAWALRVDPRLTFGYMTHARDHVIGEFFMGTTAQQFEDAVVMETDALLDMFPGRAFRFVIPSARHTLAMGVDVEDDALQNLFLGFAGGLGVGFVGPDVTPQELSTWALGGMYETGLGEDGRSWTGYRWVSALVDDPATVANVLQLE